MKNSLFTSHTSDFSTRRSLALRRWHDLIRSLPELDPCEFCGRVVLVGVCCDAALAQAQKENAK